MGNVPLSSPAGKKKTVIPGWLEHVKPIRQDMMFWHSVWISAGRPQNTQLHRIYQHLRHQYAYSVRRVKKQENEIRKQKWLNECIEGKVNNILKELRQQRKGSSPFSRKLKIL